MLISNEKTSTANVIADFCHRICAEATVRKIGSKEWQIQIPLRCQNLAGAVEVVLRAGSGRGEIARPDRLSDPPGSDHEVRQLTAALPPKLPSPSSSRILRYGRNLAYPGPTSTCSMRGAQCSPAQMSLSCLADQTLAESAAHTCAENGAVRTAGTSTLVVRLYGDFFWAGGLPVIQKKPAPGPPRALCDWNRN